MYQLLLPAIFQRKILAEALNSQQRYLGYLCPEHVVLGLFDDDISENEKAKMAGQLSQTPHQIFFTQESPDSQLQLISLLINCLYQFS